MTTAKCPLRVNAVEVASNGVFIGNPEPCNADLHIQWHFTVPLDLDVLRDEKLTRESAASVAYADAWEIVCEHGHVVAVCPDTALDYAEPLDVRSVMETFTRS